MFLCLFVSLFIIVFSKWLFAADYIEKAIAKRQSTRVNGGGPGVMPHAPGFFFKIGVKWCILRCPGALFIGLEMVKKCVQMQVKW